MAHHTPPEVKRVSSSPANAPAKALTVHGGDCFPQAEVFYPRSADTAAEAVSPPTHQADRRPQRTFARRLTSSSSRLTAASARAFQRMCSSCRLGMQRLLTQPDYRKQLQHDPLADWTTKAGCAYGVKCYDGTVLTFHEACAKGFARFPNAPPAEPTRERAYTVHGGNAYGNGVPSRKAQPI